MSIDRRTLLIAAPALLFDGCSQEFVSTLEQIRRTRSLRVGMANGAPWFELDPITDRWSGIGAAVGRLLARDLGVRFEPVETSWSQAVAGLQSNQYDIMPILDATPSRRQAIDFPDAPLFRYAMGALVDRSDLGTWAKFDDPTLRIGVALGTSGDSFATRAAPRAAIFRFTSIDEATSAFAAKRVNAVIFYYPALVHQHAKIGIGQLVLPSPAEAVTTNAGIKREPDGAWSRWLSKRFTNYEHSGKMFELFRHYAARFTSNASDTDVLARHMMGMT